MLKSTTLKPSQTSYKASELCPPVTALIKYFTFDFFCGMAFSCHSDVVVQNTGLNHWEFVDLKCRCWRFDYIKFSTKLSGATSLIFLITRLVVLAFHNLEMEKWGNVLLKYKFYMAQYMGLWLIKTAEIFV